MPICMPRSLRRREAGATHPALPAVVLLVCFAAFMAAIAPLEFSSILGRFFPARVHTVPYQNAAVWVDTRSGEYYCANSIMFGKAPGKRMKQVDALGRGYQPALGTYCTGPAWPAPRRPSRPASPPTAPPGPVSR